MKKVFFLKLFIFFSAPLTVVLLYFINDPFKVLYHYDSYYKTGKSAKVMINFDMVATQNWENHYKEGQFDSYIFGNSRAMHYQIDSWEKYINSTRCYHFDAANESILGIERKLEFLKARGATVKNALFIVDHELLAKYTNDSGHIFAKDPDLMGGSRLAFQMKFIHVFLDRTFLCDYLSYLIRGRVMNETSTALVLVDDTRHYDNMRNETIYTQVNAQIARNTDSFYQSKKNIFYTRPETQVVGSVILGKEQLELLHKMKAILSSGNTNYKIVINPLYDQVKLNPQDLNTLQQIFGASNVFDFSGINSITANKYNYFETSHYRPFIADTILAAVYRDRR